MPAKKVILTSLGADSRVAAICSLPLFAQPLLSASQGILVSEEYSIYRTAYYGTIDNKLADIHLIVLHIVKQELGNPGNPGYALTNFTTY